MCAPNDNTLLIHIRNGDVYIPLSRSAHAPHKYGQQSAPSLLGAILFKRFYLYFYMIYISINYKINSVPIFHSSQKNINKKKDGMKLLLSQNQHQEPQKVDQLSIFFIGFSSFSIPLLSFSFSLSFSQTNSHLLSLLPFLSKKKYSKTPSISNSFCRRNV